MKKNFDQSLKWVLKDEGGYTNDPRDPGGPTNYGITIIDYRKYVDPNGTASDVKNMNIETAKKIYREKYWNAIGGDTLWSGVDYACFDYGVNSGIGRVKKYLVSEVKNDKEASLLVDQIYSERLEFLQRLKTWPTFGKGWGARVARGRKNAQALIYPSNTASNTTAGGVIVAGGAAAHQFPEFLPFIIIGTIAVAVIAWFLLKRK